MIALAWAVEPSALSLPDGQAREAPDALPEVAPPGAAEPPVPPVVGSEPQADRLSTPAAAMAATCTSRLTERPWPDLVATEVVTVEPFALGLPRGHGAGHPCPAYLGS